MTRRSGGEEGNRLRALRALEVLDTEPEEDLDALVQAAAAVCGVPISLISLVDEDRQWFKANIGLPGVSETPREIAFCDHAIREPGILEVSDAALDPRFTDNPLVRQDPMIRFYAGAPLRLTEGEQVGTLCVIDHEPRFLDARQREILGLLAKAVVRILEGRRALATERTSREIAEKAAAVLSHCLDAVLFLDPEGRIRLWNEAAVAMFGYSEKEMLGETTVRLQLPDPPGAQLRPDALLEEQPSGIAFETSLIHKSGEVLPVSISLAPVQGALKGATMIVRDMRYERQLTRALAHSDARFRTLCDHLPLGVFVTDPHGSCTYTNPRWQAIYGLSLEQSLGEGWASALHPEDRARVFETWQHKASSGVEFDMRFRILTGDHGAREIHARSVALLDTAGEITCHVGSVEDITERLRADQDLEDYRRRLENILEGTGAGTWEWNVQTGETRINARWAEILGYEQEALGPTNFEAWAARVHPDDLLRARTLLELHLKGQIDDFECETRLRHREGHWVWVLDRGRLLSRTEEGEPEWMFGTHLDITERKRQEEALRQSESLLNRTGELAGIGGWELDIESSELKWSSQTKRLHGVPEDYQPTVDKALAFYPPEARKTVEAAVRLGLSEGRSWDLVIPFVSATGNRLWVRAVGNVERINGKAVRLVGAFQDVSHMTQQRHALEAAHERLALATSSGGIGVWSYDLVTGVLSWDASMYRLYGLEAGSGSGTYELWADALHPDDRERAEKEVVAAIGGVRPFDTEFRIHWPDKSVHHLRGTARIVRDVHGKALSMVGVNWDMTPLRELAAALAEERELLHVTMQSIGDAVISTDASGTVTWLNPVAERMTGWRVADALGQPLAQVFRIVNETTRVTAENPVALCLARNAPAGLANDTLLISRDGSEYGIEDSAAPIRDDQGKALGVVIVFHDVSEQRRLSAEMTYRATHDALTGLVNRAEFDKRLKQILQRSHEDHSEHALLYIDLDQFKLVNDTCGHTAGDQLLQHVAKILRSVVRSHDVLARLGGDEFGVILEGCTCTQADRLAQAICKRMDEFRFLHDESRFRVGASIGLVPVDERWPTTASLLHAADSSCYAAKEAGRNRVHVWLDDDRTLQARDGETRWATRLEQALDEGRFVLHAQRIFPLKGPGSGLHAEVLLRMKDGEANLIPPDAFLPAAERFHYASRIDRWVLDRVVGLIQSQSDLSQIDTLCVNLSGQSIGDRAFHRQAIQALSAAGPEVCERICIEITETAAIMSLADAQVFLEQLRALGVRIALDFGSGASSFGYLKSLSVDQLKIDGQFVRDVVDDPLDDAAVRCFVEVASVVGVQTVAEFVDRAEVLARLEEIQVDYAQGYYLHRPEPIETVLATETGSADLPSGLCRAPR